VSDILYTIKPSQPMSQTEERIIFETFLNNQNIGELTSNVFQYYISGLELDK